jgi:SAM-dependent methyltransferase
MDLTERQWRSTEISQTLQGSHTRTGHVTPEILRVLANFQQLRDNFPIQSEDSLTPVTENVTGRHDPLLTINLPGTWWQRKKRPQLEFMGRQIQKVVQSHPDCGTRKLRILDVGGGKGVLATYLAQILGDTVQLQVIDIADGAIKNGMMRSKRLDLSVKYFVGDASQFTDETDVVVALHACGTLSDVALGHAVNHGASFVVCPCCFRSNRHLRVPVHPDRRNDKEFLSAHEWLGVDADYFDTIQSLAEIQGDARLASEAMHTICAMRAAAFQRHSEKRKESLHVSIKTFPISFSTRNFCIVGAIERNTRWSH